MRESISIFKLFVLGLVAQWVFAVLSVSAWAQQPPPTATPPGPKAPPPASVEEEDFSTTPYTEYAAFDEEKEEEEETRFLKYGRLYALSVGTGFQGVTGNRGVLWQGGFPMVDFKLHYWFDFHLAMDLNFYMVAHSYDTTSSSDTSGKSTSGAATTTEGQSADIAFNRVGADLKYYFDTHNLVAAISAANPYVLGGVGSYSKTETNNVEGAVEQKDSSIGVCGGLGMEFALKPRRIYLTLEGKVHMPSFKDNNSSTFQTNPGITDLTGYFYTANASIMFSW